MADQKKIVVIGGGIVGITSALELRRRGHQVTLLDPKQPGRETSYGNSGLLSGASVSIINNPGLIRQLPKLLRNRGTKLRYSPLFVLKNLVWVLRFLSHCTDRHYLHAARALRALQVLSLDIHKALIADAGVDALLRPTGWLKVFRSEASFQAYDLERKALDHTGVPYTVYTGEQLSQLEPGLKYQFFAGVLLEDACSLASPGALCDAYVTLLTDAGGTVKTGGAKRLEQLSGGRWKIELVDGATEEADEIILAAGPWSPDIASTVGYNIPMRWERGYHVHLDPGDGRVPSRAVHDVDGGYVMSPQQLGVRVTSGVELTHRDAPPNYAQIEAAADLARAAAGLGDAVEQTPWMGRRPTLVDSLPMIGKAPRHDGLWFNFGHQHTGLCMSAGSARVLSDLVSGETPPIDVSPFRPERFHL
jgi:D-amino-acid dehydrogenase